MTLYKRGNVWWVKYMVDGVLHRQSCHTGNRKVAAAWVQSIEIAAKMPTFEDAVEVLRVMYSKPKVKTLELGAAWEVYLDLAKSVGRDKISPDTMRKRAGAIRTFCAWCAKEAAAVRYVEQVNGAVAAAYAGHLAREGKKSKTRRNILGELSTVWKMLEKHSDAIRNPWGNLAPVDDDSERGKAFSAEEVERVLEAAKRVGLDWWGVCTVALVTGLRYGDVANLRWAALALPGEAQDEGDKKRTMGSWEGGVLRVQPRKTQRHGIQTAFPIIGQLSVVFDNQPRRGDFVFPLHAEMYGKSHGAHGSHKAALPFREVLEAAGLAGQGFTFHSLRHTAATRLADAGVGIETRKRILGHTEDATAERYDHAEHLEEVRAAMEAAEG